MRLAMTKWASPLQPGSASAAFFPTYATSGVGLPYRSGKHVGVNSGTIIRRRFTNPLTCTHS